MLLLASLGVVAGASQITQGGRTITTSGLQAFSNGAASSVSQSATTILDRFIQIPPPSRFGRVTA